MTPRPGRPSSRSPNGPARARWGIDLLVGLGVVASSGLIAVSALLNYRMGYRSADTPLDGMLYGSGAALGDTLKAMAPFMASWGWRNRDVVATAAATLIFIVFTCYSLTAALGFAAQHRAAKAGQGRGAIERHADLRHELDRVSQRLEILGPQRTVPEIDAARHNILQRPLGKGQTVGTLSAACTINRSATREACADYGRLAEEQARADEAQTLGATASGLRTKLAAGTNSNAPTSSDPQLDAVAQAASYLPLTLTRPDLEFALSALLALLIELGSGAGLYMVTTPWRERRPTPEVDKHPRRRWRTFPRHQPRPKTPAHLERFILERLEPRPSATLPLAAVHADYRRWCGHRGNQPLTWAAFEQDLTDLAKGLGLTISEGEGGLVIRNTGLATQP